LAGCEAEEEKVVRRSRGGGGAVGAGVEPGWRRRGGAGLGVRVEVDRWGGVVRRAVRWPRLADRGCARGLARARMIAGCLVAS
jgi:hypothetical protein